MTLKASDKAAFAASSTPQLVAVLREIARMRRGGVRVSDNMAAEGAVAAAELRRRGQEARIPAGAEAD